MNVALDELDLLAARTFDGFVVRKDLVRTFSRQFPVPTYVVQELTNAVTQTTTNGVNVAIDKILMVVSPK